MPETVHLFWLHLQKIRVFPSLCITLCNSFLVYKGPRKIIQKDDLWLCILVERDGWKVAHIPLCLPCPLISLPNFPPGLYFSQNIIKRFSFCPLSTSVLFLRHKHFTSLFSISFQLFSLLCSTETIIIHIFAWWLAVSLSCIPMSPFSLKWRPACCHTCFHVVSPFSNTVNRFVPQRM